MTLSNAANNKSPGLQYLQNSGVFTAVDGATNTLLQGGGTNTVPAFTAYPQISGLGIGASPGSTAGITFDGSNFLNTYSIGTFSPTMIGSSTAGTTTYTTQQGYYSRIGFDVYLCGKVAGSAATGTGNVLFGAYPFTIKNNTNASWLSSVEIVAAQTFPVSLTQAILFNTFNTTTASLRCMGTASVSAALAIANVAFDYNFSAYYQT